MTMGTSVDDNVQVGVIVSAHAEWETVRAYYHEADLHTSPFGQFFTHKLGDISCILFHGGWGKVSAAAGTQYLIDRWHPEIILNIGTCGGLAGQITAGEIFLANETLIYDIHERMNDPMEAIHFYTTSIDLSFLSYPLPHSVRIGRLLSADQDIDPAMVASLRSEYDAVAADWESGAIAWTAARNHTRVLILRGVTDLVDSGGGELYNQGDFTVHAREVMLPLLRALPDWINCAIPKQTANKKPEP